MKALTETCVNYLIIMPAQSFMIADRTRGVRCGKVILQWMVINSL